MLQTFNEQNRDLIVNINGKLSHRDEAGVSPFDSSVQNGDGVWEGLRLYDGRIFRLQAHLDRLRGSAAALDYRGFPEDSLLRQELARTLDANSMTDGVHVRLTVFAWDQVHKWSRSTNQHAGVQFLHPRGTQAAGVRQGPGITLKVAAHRRPPSDVLDQTIHFVQSVDVDSREARSERRLVPTTH